MVRLICLGLGCTFAAAALAQTTPGGTEGLLLQRQQYQEELLLRQRQSQELANPALTPSQRLVLERRHFDQAQRQRELHDSQVQRHLPLQQGLPQLPPARQQEQLRYEQWRFENERDAERQSLHFDP